MAERWSQDFETEARDEIRDLSSQYYKDLIRITLTRKASDQKITVDDVRLANQILRGQVQQKTMWAQVSNYGASIAGSAGTTLLLVNVTTQPDEFPILALTIICFFLGGLFLLIAR